MSNAQPSPRPATTTEVWFGWSCAQPVEVIASALGVEVEDISEVIDLLQQEGIDLKGASSTWDGHIEIDHNQNVVKGIGLLVAFASNDPLEPEEMHVPLKINGNEKWQALVAILGKPRLLIQHF